MADVKISALSAAASVADANEWAINEAGVNKKVTSSQLATYLNGKMFTALTGVIRSDAGTLSVDSGVADIVTAASDTAQGKMEVADQTEMEAGSDVARVVTPGNQHFHPSACKFWVKWTANSTTRLASYNVSAIADTATGDADGTLATSFSGADWAGIVATQETTNGWDNEETQSCGFNATAAGTFGVMTSTITDGGVSATVLVDPDQWHAMGFGDF